MMLIRHLMMMILQRWSNVSAVVVVMFNTMEIVVIETNKMNAFKTSIPRRGEKLQRRRSADSFRGSVSPMALKAHKKKDRPSVQTVLADEDIEIIHQDAIQENEDNVSETPPVVTAILPVSECEDILKLTTQEMERTLQEQFELNADTDLKDAILLDYYVAAIHWARQQNYTAQQLSDFFNVVHVMIHSVKEEHASVVELIKDLQMMVNGSGKDLRPIDRSLQFFSNEEKKAVIGYFFSSLFRHLKLYQYAFSRGQSEEIIINELAVELPLPAETPFPPSLDEGMSDSVMNEYLILNTPPSEEEVLDTAITPSDIELPLELVDVFAKLTLEDVKNIINETSAAVLSNLQSDFESKIKTHEAAVLGKITKIRGEDSSNTAVL